MRVLYVTHGGGAGKAGLPSGAARVAIDLAANHSAGFTSAFVFLGRDGGGTLGAVDALDSRGIRHHDVAWAGSNNAWSMLAAAAKLFRIIRSEKPDVVCLNAVPATYLGLLPARLAQVPVVAIVHLIPSDRRERAMAGFLRFTDHVVFVSNGLRDYYRRAGYVPGGSVIQNGIQLQRFLDLSGRELKAPPYCISMVARLQPPHKDPIALLEAFALLRKRGYPARLRFVGDGPGRQEIEALARRLGIQAEVEITGYTDRVVDHLADTDIFALSTRWEGQPLSIMEAMAAGLPVVASRVIGVTDIVDEGKTGLLVPPESPDNMAEAIGWLLDHPEEARALGQGGKIKAKSVYAAARMTAEYEALFLALVSKHAHRA